MRITTYRTSSGFISMEHGSEGPIEDPYSYTEITVKRRGHRTATIHYGGLVHWSFVRGRGRLKRFNPERDLDRFEKAVGFTLRQIEKFCYKADERSDRFNAEASEQAAGWDASP